MLTHRSLLFITHQSAVNVSNDNMVFNDAATDLIWTIFSDMIMSIKSRRSLVKSQARHRNQNTKKYFFGDFLSADFLQKAGE